MPTPLQRLNRRRQKEQKQQNHKSQQPTPIISPKESYHSQDGNSIRDEGDNVIHLSRHTSGEDSKPEPIWSSNLHQKLSIDKSISNSDGNNNSLFGEKPVYFHSSTFSDAILFLNPAYFPGVKEGDIIYLLDKASHPPIYLEVGHNPSVNSNIAISIHENAARHLHLKRHQMVQVGCCPRESTALNSVEVNIVDGCLPRHEIWYLLHSLQDHFVYVNQRLQVNGCEVEVSSLIKDNKNIFGGLITSSTNVIFCRSSCRMYVVIHITREILCVDNSGYLRGEIVTDYCLQRIQELWKQGNTHHLLTVLLYMDLDLISQQQIIRQCIPHIQILCKDHSGSLEDFKYDIKHFISEIGSDFSIPSLSDASNLYILSKSEVSSPLTVLNMILKDIKYNKQTASFTVNGSHILFITPSVPMYFVDNTYYFITQDSLHEAAVGVDLISVAPVSPFKAPLIHFRYDNSFPIDDQESSVVAGFMPAIFYSVESNDFVQSLDRKDYSTIQQMQKHLHSFYNQANLYKHSLESLPTILPELPYSIHLAYHQHNPSLQEILSGDETDNAANPSFSQDSTGYNISNSPDDELYNHSNIGTHLSSYDSPYGSLENYRQESESGTAGSGTFDSYLIRPSRQTSLSHRLFSPSDFTLLSNPSFSDRSSIDLTQQSYISRSTMYNDDILFWIGRKYDNHYAKQFIRSMIRPAIFPLLVGDLALETTEFGQSNNYSIFRSRFRDHILIRLKYNFQFEKRIPSLDSIENVILHQRRKEKHTLSVSGSTVHFQTETSKGPIVESMKGEILIKYPNYKGIVSRNVEIQQPAINWNKIDFTIVAKNVRLEDLPTMKHYNRLHYLIYETNHQETRIDQFIQFLKKKFPFLQVSSVPSKQRILETMFVKDEVLLVVHDKEYCCPFQFHLDLYWCVASLQTILLFENEIKKAALKANLLFIHYPDEICVPFTESISPFFFWYEVSFSNISTSYLLKLIDFYFIQIDVIHDRFVSFTDVEMSNYAQLDKEDKLIRIMKKTHLYGDHCMQCRLKEMIEIIDYMEQLTTNVQ